MERSQIVPRKSVNIKLKKTALDPKAFPALEWVVIVYSDKAITFQVFYLEGRLNAKTQTGV